MYLIIYSTNRKEQENQNMVSEEPSRSTIEIPWYVCWLHWNRNGQHDVKSQAGKHRWPAMWLCREILWEISNLGHIGESSERDRGKCHSWELKEKIGRDLNLSIWFSPIYWLKLRGICDLLTNVYRPGCADHSAYNFTSLVLMKDAPKVTFK